MCRIGRRLLASIVEAKTKFSYLIFINSLNTFRMSMVRTGGCSTVLKNSFHRFLQTEYRMASPAQQQEYLNKVREQMQSQFIQEVMNKMSEKCFKVAYLMQ